MDLIEKCASRVEIHEILSVPKTYVALGDKSSWKNLVEFDISNCSLLDERHGVIIGEHTD